jgi:hypothetical protein
MAVRKKKGVPLAPRGDAVGLAAIRLWIMQLETVMVKRYIGNAPTLPEIQKISSEALRKLKAIKPALMSDCAGGWPHEPGCECGPPPI